MSIRRLGHQISIPNFSGVTDNRSGDCLLLVLYVPFDRETFCYTMAWRSLENPLVYEGKFSEAA